MLFGSLPYSIYKKLGLQKPQSTNISVFLADMTLTYPQGIVENLLVKVRKFIFPTDFVILNIEEDEEIPIILEQSFIYASGIWLIFNKEK